MKKLTSLLKRLDDNLLHYSLVFFLFAAALVPKIPITYVEYTYVRIRYDDFIALLIYLIFAIQFLRRKVKLNTKFLWHIVVFWTAVFISFLIGYYFQNTIAVQNLGLLHSLRRVQYMLIFFVASSVIVTEERFKKYLNLYLIALGIVAFWGIGQKFLGFPSIQSMNPAYSDGRLLYLNPEDRINSTFGGHFDLAAYLTFSIPIVIGLYLSGAKKTIFYIGAFLLSLVTLLYTAARSSFVAYLTSVSVFLLYVRKIKLYLIVLPLTIGLFFVTGEMAKRFQSTFQQKTIFVNTQTGDVRIDQKITTKELPAGGYEIPVFGKKKTTKVTDEQLEKVALETALSEAKKSGRHMNTFEIQNRANEISKYLQPQKTILCDIACATRLQLEWPRAIAAFSYNPIFGTGPSSISEATDNDILRWLGETGLIGTGAFLFLLFSIARFVWKNGKKEGEDRTIYFGFVFGLIALLINALYVDVFEASKVAYQFWLVAGVYVGYLSHKYEERGKGKKA